MDGFMVNGKFYCKELGTLKVGDGVAKSFFFNTGLRWKNLNAKDKRACMYVMRHIHKLPFNVPHGVESFEISTLEEIICNFYQTISISRYISRYISRKQLASTSHGTMTSTPHGTMTSTSYRTMTSILHTNYFRCYTDPQELLIY